MINSENLFPILLIILAVYLGNKRLSYGCALMIAVRCILPPIIRLGALSLNSVIIIVVFFICIHKVIYNPVLKQNVMRKKWMFPLLYLTIPLAILGIGAPLDLGFQYKALVQFVVTEILPFFIIAVAVQEKKDYELLLKTFLYSYAVIGIWGVATYFLKSNPFYTFFISDPRDESIANFTGDGSMRIRGGLSSSASGNLSGPLPWGQFSLLVFLFFLLYYENKKNILYFSTLYLAMANCFLTAKRSILLPVILAFGCYFYKNGLMSKKKMLGAVFVVIATIFFLGYSHVADAYLQNVRAAIFVWDDTYATKISMGGSSKESRMLQLTTAFQMIENNLIAGLGYNYPAYYQQKNGMHPIMIGYESIVFTMVSSGLVGMSFWFAFFWKGFCFTRYGNELKWKNHIFHCCYFLSLLLTGVQASLYLYMIIVAMQRRKNELVWEDRF